MKLIGGWIDTAKEYNLMQFSWLRGGVKPTHLVIHGTAGGSTGDGTLAYEATVQDSTHFAISTNGDIWQGVSTDNAAWGNAPLMSPRLNFDNANINPNLWTISIEFCKPDPTNKISITDKQFASGVALVSLICTTYGIPRRRSDGHSGIVGHCDLNSVERAMCPGTFDWDAFFAALNPVPKPVITIQPAWMSHASLAHGGTKAMAISTAQAAQFQKTWNLSTHTSGYGSGIGLSWQEMNASGFRIGPPTSDEYSDTDQSNPPHAIRTRQFGDFRCEWRNNQAYWHGGYGALIVK